MTFIKLTRMQMAIRPSQKLGLLKSLLGCSFWFDFFGEEMSNAWMTLEDGMTTEGMAM